MFFVQVSFQLRILPTALFAVIFLRTKVRWTQWCSLLVLLAGIGMVLLAKDDQNDGASTASNSTQVNTPSAVHNDQNRLLGFSAVFIAAVFSSLGSIFLEKMMKDADIPVSMRNVQMSLLSIPIGILPCFFQDYKHIAENGFFHGYDWFVVYVIVLNASGGIIAGITLKYADNISKGFATSLGIVITCVAAIFLFDFIVTIQFVIGASFVIAAIFLYGYIPKPEPTVITV